MAAYAALTCLNVTIEEIPDSVVQNRPQTKALKEKTTFLLQFLEEYSESSSKEIQDLEKMITDLGRAAEYVIESHVVRQTLVSSRVNWQQSCSLFFDDLQKVVQVFDSIKEKAMKIMEAETNVNQLVRSSKHHDHTVPSRTLGNITVVGFDEHIIRIMDRITSQESGLQVIPIVSMGGIGKTTLTRAVYDNKLIKEYFDIRLWCTISQSYDMHAILLAFLHQLQINVPEDYKDDSGELLLYKYLSGRRYLVVMDDLWSIDAWDRLRRFFPNNGNGSWIIVTTRLLSLASHDIGSCDPFKLEFMNENESWSLLKKVVFGKHACPSILEYTGRQIAVSCQGLPLALVVVGGQLAKSDMTLETWKRVRGAINSVVNSDNDDYCLKTLFLSYDNLPAYLKPCFLYMGVFPEDHEIRVCRLVKSWVAEGFLKPIRGKCFEETAMEYLTNLVERNLILVSKRGSSGKIKTCRIHDLLRDLCLRKAQEEKFLSITAGSRGFHDHPVTNGQVHHSLTLEPLRSTFLVTNRLDLLSGYIAAAANSRQKNLWIAQPRCLTLSAHWSSSAIPAQITMFWNLQTLIVNDVMCDGPVVLPPQIWEMSLLRHIEIKRVMLPNPPDVGACDNVKEHYGRLENLQTLLVVHGFELHEEVIKRVPNVRKLKVIDSKHLENLVQLRKLESLSCSMEKEISISNISFPVSLKRLTLDGGRIPWEDMTVVGSLPNLETLRLLNDAFHGTEWIPNEDEFCCLKTLYLKNISLQQWKADSFHFPRLESLNFSHVRTMTEIPPGIGDIATLQFISLEYCSIDLAKSAMQLQQDQESMENVIRLHVQSSVPEQPVIHAGSSDHLKSFRLGVHSFSDELLNFFKASIQAQYGDMLKNYAQIEIFRLKAQSVDKLQPVLGELVDSVHTQLMNKSTEYSGPGTRIFESKTRLERKALKSAQRTETSQGRRLQCPKRIPRRNNIRMSNTPQCRWRS